MLRAGIVHDINFHQHMRFYTLIYRSAVNFESKAWKIQTIFTFALLQLLSTLQFYNVLLRLRNANSVNQFFILHHGDYVFTNIKKWISSIRWHAYIDQNGAIGVVSCSLHLLFCQFYRPISSCLIISNPFSTLLERINLNEKWRRWGNSCCCSLPPLQSEYTNIFNPPTSKAIVYHILLNSIPLHYKL